jgi:predicted ester cyclase
MTFVSRTAGHARVAAEWLNCTPEGEQESDMTSNLDVIKAWRAVPSGDLEASAAYLSDDFQNVDKDGKVLMDKEGYIGMGHMLRASLPDFEFVHTALREEGDFVIMTGHFEGTLTGDLDMSTMGLGVIPASGNKIVWPEVSVKITVEGDKIAKEEPYGESGGMEAFLAPLLGQRSSA